MRNLKLKKRQLVGILASALLLGAADTAQEKLAANLTAPTIALVDLSFAYLAKQTALSPQERNLASIARIR